MNIVNTAFKNHSMLEKTGKEKTFSNANQIPIGHVYSVIVERVNIENPNIKKTMRHHTLKGVVCKSARF